MSLDIPAIIVGFLAITIAITVHEFAHAWVANALGDPTPGEHGRLTLNPMVLWQSHPFGTIIAPLIGAASGFLMGWAATPIDVRRVRRSITMRRANLYISAAGPISNVLLGLLSVLLLALTWRWVQPGSESFIEPLGKLLQFLILANVILAVFNILPIPPLDGFHVLSSLAPPSWEKALGFLEQFGMIILLVIILRGELVFGPLIRGAFAFTGWAIHLVNG